MNRKDPAGRNVFEGGFLGLDNIGVFDRSAPLPTGGRLGTGRRHGLDGAVLPEHAGDRRLELALHDPIYEDYDRQVREHFLMDRRGHGSDRRQAGDLWDEEDGFFYDLIRLPDGGAMG